MTDALVTLESADFAYPGKPCLFKGLDFALRPGMQIGLHGPNGSGKTTFFRLLMGLEKLHSGSLLLHGKPVRSEADLRRLRCTIGLILQNAEDQLFSPTVLEDVAFGPLNLGLGRDEARQRAVETLESMGMADFADRLTHRLSGGEKKLISIATVLSMRPEALLLDEPTAFLDEGARQKLIAILRALPTPRIIISHDHCFLEQTASLFMSVSAGKLNEATRTLPPAECCRHRHSRK